MSSATSRRIRGVLFDVDGSLIDSTFIHTVCWWQAFRHAELDVPMAVLHRAVGMGADHLVDHVLSEIRQDGQAVQQDRIDVEALAASHDALYSAHWPALRPLPGARDLVRHCHQQGLVTVLASSSQERELGVLMQALDVGDAIDVTTSSADAESSKPDPDILSVALAKAGLVAEQAIFIGDAVWDVQASNHCGLPCIGLESGGTSAAELRDAGAVATYQHPQDLLQHSEEWLA